MTNLLSFFGIIGSTFLSVWVAVKYFLFDTYRLDGSTSKSLFDIIRTESKYVWSFGGDFTAPPRYPGIWEAFVILRGVPMYYSRHERLLNAGWKGKEEQTTVAFPRIMRSKIDALLFEDPSARTIPINLLNPSDPDRLGELEVDPKISPPPLALELYEDIENDLQRMLAGEIKKTSAILHGPPGNGKSRFVRYLATKYSLPINVVQLGADWDNHHILLMFASIPKRSIVLLEDFDNHFHGREPAIKNDVVKFTFDSIINSLDGVHNDYRQVMFIMTVNDLDKVDHSLKERPSRFKFVREFGPPTDEVRMRILKDQKLVDLSRGMSLDKVFLAADRPETLLKSGKENEQLNLPYINE